MSAIIVMLCCQTARPGRLGTRSHTRRSCPRKRFRLDKHVEIQRGLSYPPRLESECRMEQALLVNVLQRVIAVCRMRRFVQSPGLGPA